MTTREELEQIRDEGGVGRGDKYLERAKTFAYRASHPIHPIDIPRIAEQFREVEREARDRQCIAAIEEHDTRHESKLRAIVAAGDALKGPAGRMQELCEDAQTVCFDNDSDSESAERYAAAIAAWDVATKEAR
jgi:hypothetical protein